MLRWLTLKCKINKNHVSYVVNTHQSHKVYYAWSSFCVQQPRTRHNYMTRISKQFCSLWFLHTCDLEILLMSSNLSNCDCLASTKPTSTHLHWPVHRSGTGCERSWFRRPPLCLLAHGVMWHSLASCEELLLGKKLTHDTGNINHTWKQHCSLSAKGTVRSTQIGHQPYYNKKMSLSWAVLSTCGFIFQHGVRNVS